MSSVDTIIAVASWEPRFLLGMRRLVTERRPRQILLYYYKQYAERTTAPREAVRAFCTECDVPVQETELHFCEPAASWVSLAQGLAKATSGKDVLVDISTMPRETIWAVLFWLQASAARIQYVYYRPEAYGKGWLARDPDEPRFGYKLGGSPILDRPTALLAVTGFDVDRALQAFEFFEPKEVVLAVQTGSQFDNTVRNVAAHETGAFKKDLVRTIAIDAYGQDHGYAAIRAEVERLVTGFNIVLCSFGPKLSAVSLFRVQREFPLCALAYIHCRDYNSDYSVGIGEGVWGEVATHSLTNQSRDTD